MSTVSKPGDPAEPPAERPAGKPGKVAHLAPEGARARQAGGQPAADAAEKAAQQPAPKPGRGAPDDSAEETGAGPAPAAKPAAPPIPPPAPAARLHRRHLAVALSFVARVLLPVAVSVWYLTNRAVPQYVSETGFSVRTEELASAFELLGGVAELSGSSSSDTDILYRFIQSSQMVRLVDGRLDLRALWAKADPARDPVFAFHPPGTIEDLTAYWGRMVTVYSDSGTGLIDLEVSAFTPEDARAVAQAIYDEASLMINRLSDIAREDSTRYAAEELDKAVERLKNAREAMTRFRNETQIVDPTASIQSQMGILSSLQAELAQTLIALDTLRDSTTDTDPRVTQAERRVEVIENRIAEERRKLGIGEARSGSASGTVFADVIGEYERLAVDLEFAQQSYTAALAAYDAALGEAQRQSRYLAAHITPSLPEAPQHPAVWASAGLVALFSFLAWAILVLAGYAIRDRR